jgi:hypothetical protein
MAHRFFFFDHSGTPSASLPHLDVIASADDVRFSRAIFVAAF